MIQRIRREADRSVEGCRRRRTGCWPRPHAVAAALALAVTCSPSPAGDWTTDSYLERNDAELTRVPMPGFHALLRRIVPRRVGTLVELPSSDVRYVPRLRDDISDLVAVQRERLGPDAPPVPADPDADFIREFRLYLDGRAAHERGDRAAALCAFSEILDRPADGRQWRSTRAAYMIGRSVQNVDPALAGRWFRAVRALAAEGCADTLGLACASLGWEARSELDQGNLPRALALYLEQYAAGDPSAVPSILLACRRELGAGSDALDQLALDPIARQAITAWMLRARRGYDYQGEADIDNMMSQWCMAIEELGIAREGLPDIDVLAAFALEAGHDHLAEAWAAASPAEAVLARWVRVKMACRSGGLHEAIAAMRTLAESDASEFPASEQPVMQGGAVAHGRKDFPSTDGHGPFRSRALCELGAMLVSAGDFDQAFDAFVSGRSLEDAKYLLERVFSADRAAALVDGAFPDPASAFGPPSPASGMRRHAWEPTVAEQLRELVGARFMREGRYAEARPFLAAQERGKAELLQFLVSRAHDANLPDAARAAAFWDAARMVRHECAGISATSSSFYVGSRRESFEFGKLSMPTADEMVRWNSSAPVPDTPRFMRYRAADLAWDAALLMPDESPETAEVLCEAGRWLAPQDPKAADRFYKALVRRCGTTVLGAEADRRRWFPPRTGSAG